MYFVLIVINTLFPVICATLDLFTKFRTKLFEESFNIQMLCRSEKNMVIEKSDHRTPSQHNPCSCHSKSEYLQLKI